MEGLVTWLSGLPAGVLYLSLCAIAAAENVFPPLPTDTVVALGTWLAARGGGSAIWAFLSTFAGNVAGAAAMYLVGRRHGTAWMRRRLPALADERGEARLRTLYARYGLVALFVSRFVPGVRALVPPFAGALQVPAIAAISAMATASAVWYGVVSYVAYQAGADWAAVTRLVARSGRAAALVGAAGVVVIVVTWIVHRRRGRADP